LSFTLSGRRRARLATIAVSATTLAGMSAPLATGAPAMSKEQRARVLERIAQCESGGDPRAISANGRYRGKYQFSFATWRSVGGKGDPARASERRQDRLADRLLRRAGTSPWPNCA
jgi:hypothetical protein